MDLASRPVCSALPYRVAAKRRLIVDNVVTPHAC